MPNTFFKFKQFTIHQDRSAMKVTTDACLFGGFVVSSEFGVGSSEPAGSKKILDIGTGTGLLSLMLAQQCDAMIDAVEIDVNAAEQARENVNASPWKKKINVIHDDIKEVITGFFNKFDVIITNPPFYENELASPNDQKNIAHHQGGLLLNDLLQVIKQTLNDDGRFYLLLPYKRIAEAETLLQKNQLAISEMVLVRQSTNHGFFRIFIKGKHAGNSEKDYIKSELSICDDKQQYTKEFIALLKDYYLYL